MEEIILLKKTLYPMKRERKVIENYINIEEKYFKIYIFWNTFIIFYVPKTVESHLKIK